MGNGSSLEIYIQRLFQSIGIQVRMPEDISKQFRKKISLKEFEVTNSGGEYSQGLDVKEAGKKLKIKKSQEMKEKWSLT